MIFDLSQSLRLKIAYRDRYCDERGFNAELFRKSDEEIFGIAFIQESMSFSKKKHTLRGLHGDNKTWKLISCLLGKLYVVVLNHDESSEKYGKWESFEVSQQNGLQILIPPNFANGHLVISDGAIFHYK